MSLKELEGLLDKYSPMMDAQTEMVVDKVIKYGTVFAEVGSHMGILPLKTSQDLTPSS